MKRVVCTRVDVHAATRLSALDKLSNVSTLKIPPKSRNACYPPRGRPAVSRAAKLMIRTIRRNTAQREPDYCFRVSNSIC
jgi:hypothetical protein